MLTARSLAGARDALLAAGYAEGAVLENYSFVARNGHLRQMRADLAAFSEETRHDIETSCIGVLVVDSEAETRTDVAMFAYLGTPLVIALEDREAQVWRIEASGPPQLIDTVTSSDLRSYLGSRRDRYAPEAIARRKRISYQLSFYDADASLLAFARAATREILSRQFEEAVDAGVSELEGLQNQAGLRSQLNRVSIELLGASILEDKLWVDNGRSESVADLLSRASRHYPNYFSVPAVPRRLLPAAEAILNVLRHGLTFRSFTNDMLGYFYEEALVTPAMRRDMGVFYTPRSLAERMLARLPIEELEPNRRDVLDPTCGSASLLVAAYGRLQSLLPHQMKRHDAHRYLTRHLHGVDKDPFAAGVARLALFLRDLPEGDSWDIRQGDSLQPKTTDGLRPSIIVGNPPFREALGARSQVATRFLQRSMDILEDGGLMAMVLPETFLVAHSGDEARRHLFETFDVMEILQLPEGEFRSSAATAVVVARKLVPPKAYALLIERVAGTSTARMAFRTAGEVSMSSVTQIDAGRAPNPTALVASVSSAIIGKLAAHPRLSELVRVKNGIIVGKRARSSVGTERRSTHSRPWLAGTHGLRPFNVDNSVYPDRFIEYTDQLQWDRDALMPYFETPRAKALVNANRATTSPWRLKAAVDDKGYFPSQGLHCLIPRSGDVDLDEIVAVLNSMAINLWIDTYNRTRWIREGMVEDLPYPTLSAHARATLRRLAMSAASVMASRDNSPAGGDIAGILEEIDAIVVAGFGLSPSEAKTIEQYFQPHRRPGADVASAMLVEAPTASAGERWALGGRVVDVDGDRGALKVYLDGLNDDELIDIDPLPPGIPGWMLRPGVEFEATIPLAARLGGTLADSDLADFRVREFGYCDQEELRRILTDPKRLLKLYD